HADHLPVALDPVRKIGKPGVLRGARYGQDLLLEEGAVALDPGKERRADRVGEVVLEARPGFLAPGRMRLDRGLPDSQALGGGRVDPRELVEGLLDRVARGDPAVGLPRPEALHV